MPEGANLEKQRQIEKQLSTNKCDPRASFFHLDDCPWSSQLYVHSHHITEIFYWGKLNSLFYCCCGLSVSPDWASLLSLSVCTVTEVNWEMWCEVTTDKPRFSLRKWNFRKPVSVVLTDRETILQWDEGNGCSSLERYIELVPHEGKQSKKWWNKHIFHVRSASYCILQQNIKSNTKGTTKNYKQWLNTLTKMCKLFLAQVKVIRSWLQASPAVTVKWFSC